MSIDIHLYPYRLPFLRGFGTAHGVLAKREGAIVEVKVGHELCGIGEIAPLPQFAGESLALARAQLPQMATLLRDKSLEGALALLEVEARAQRWQPSLCCGLEIALFDALGKVEQRSISALLAPRGDMPRLGVHVNTVIAARETQAAVAAALAARDTGFGCVKLKVGFGDSIEQEIERVAAVRAALGPACHLRLDANEAWGFEEALAVLSACVRYDIQYIEQPLKARDLPGMRELRQAVSTPIAADEAISSLESARLVLDYEAADVLIIKPQLAGGLRVGLRIIQEATARAVQCVITSALEAGIGLAASLHLAAASPDVTLECGLATLPLLADDLLLDELPVHHGFLATPSGPGLGVTLDREALERYGSNTEQ